MITEHHLEPGSFRDKTSRVFYVDGQILRGLNAEALDAWTAFTSSTLYTQLVQEHKIPITQRAADQSPWAAVLQHEAIPFVSYPYEWPFGMLKDAAALQLELTRRALQVNLILKDATPYNIQWIGSRPIFIDVASFIPWTAGSAWVGYKQFCELFLYPLILQAYRHVPFQAWLRGSLDGIPVEDCRQIWTFRDLFRPGILKDVVLHSQLQHQFSQSQRALQPDLQKAGFSSELILSNVTRLEKLVNGLTWKRPQTEWSHYADIRRYPPEDYERKRKFVQTFARSKPRKQVWDLGSNTGDFSRLVAETADQVIAMEADDTVAEGFYQELRKENNLKILPLVMNLANPSTGAGWRGLERKALVDRGRPDLILCLALLHHLVISAHIPLDEWIHWLAALSSDLVIEFVSPDDPMTLGLLRNKAGRHDDYTQANFEKHLSAAYQIQETLTLCGGLRTVYACSAKK